ncbi:MAG: hypothetical protein Q3M24_15575 [Candidatus Electrothrix aestuarii]|uniref:Uncharacterized protein n=1 Tax=Candidatus Electrothrix aestuarii TaxID=3062594 RepID=A0AAU8LS79_9BACT|nr:hypothetical protein [Candidatus Electrothrix aestuarii]
MKLWKILVISLLLVIGSISNAVAHDLSGLRIEKILVCRLYENKSAFTQVPAGIGGLVSTVPAFVIGSAGYLVGYGLGFPLGKEEEFAQGSVFITGFGLIQLGSGIVGAPFFVVEKIFYDLPQYLFKQEAMEETPQAIAERHWNESLPRSAPKKATRQQALVRVEQAEPPCVPRPTVDPETGEVRLKAGHALQAAAGYPPNKYCDETDE